MHAFQNWNSTLKRMETMEAGDSPQYLLEKFTKERKTVSARSDTRVKTKLGQRETKGK